MSADLPYMQTVGNLPAILAKIRSAGTPPKFTNSFLTDALGFKSSGDRGVIGILKALGFLTADGLPTARYNDYRQSDRSGQVLAQGLREGWPELFLADQQAHDKNAAQLTELFKNVTGKGEAVARKMATTFKSLAHLADWTAAPLATEPVEEPATQETKPEEVTTPGRALSLHNDVHIHLPTSVDVAVYTAIFRAIREELLGK